MRSEYVTTCITPLCSGGGKEKCGLLKGNANEGPPAYRLPRRCAPRNDGELGIDKRWEAGIMKIKRGAAGRREPLSSYRVTAERPSLWRLLLFYLENQRNDGYDQNTEVKEIRIRDHDITPLLCSGGGKKFRPPPEEGASRLPNTGSASAYPCAGDIIARFVEFGNHNFDMF